MTWNLEELRELASSCLGKSIVSNLNPSLNSIVLKIAFAKYHADETQSIIDELISEAKKDEPTKIAKLILEQATDSEAGKKFRLAQFRAEANIIAFAQTLHSTADVLSQIIFISLNLSNNQNFKIKQDRLYLGNLTNELIRIGEYSTLTSSLEKLLNSNEFEYLSAFVNTTKHICLINSRYSLSFVEESDPCHGMRIADFAYKGKRFEKKWSEIFLGEDFKFLNTSIVESGIILNQFLK